MTQAAARLSRLPVLRALGRLSRVSPPTAFGIRFATAVCTALWLGQAPGLREVHSSWIFISLVMVMRPVAAGSLTIGILRAAGTAAAFVVAIALYGLFAQDPPLLVAGLFLVQALGAYGYTGPRYQYAWFVFAFTVGTIIGDSLSQTKLVETVAFERATMVAFGILIAFVFDALLWPRRAEEEVRQGLAARARRLSALLRRTLSPGQGAQEPADAPEGSLAALLALVEQAGVEPGVSRRRVEALADIAMSLETLSVRERILERPTGADPAAVARLHSVLTDLAFAVEAVLAESARALAADRAPAPVAPALDRAALALAAELEHARVDAAADPLLEGFAAELQELVEGLKACHGLLVRLASESARDDEGSRVAPAAIRLRVDPFRVAISLRTGIAVCGALVLVMALGWEFNNMVGPVAFMIAAAPTRGGAGQAAVGLFVTLGVAWALADVAAVYFAPYVSQMPLALAFPFAVAFVFGRLSATRPQLETLRKIGTLVALLPVFASGAAPIGVDGVYDTVCYAALAIGVAFVSTRLLWPATAARMFQGGASALLSLYGRALRARPSTAGPAERREFAEILAAYTQQLTRLGSLHAQASREPVERALSTERRGELLALLETLFDAALTAKDIASDELEPLLQRGGDALEGLRAARARVNDALFASLQAVLDRLSGDDPIPGPDLAAAQDAFEECLAALRQTPERLPALDAHERETFLAELHARRRVVDRLHALEVWCADWERAEEAPVRG